MPAPLIEFPADDPDRARRFSHGVLGVTLAPRPAAAGSGWQSDTDGLRLGVHERGPAPATLPPCPTSPSPTWPRHSSASASSAARSSTLAIGGPSAGTPRAARSRWPPRPRSTGTIAARAKRRRCWSAPDVGLEALSRSSREAIVVTVHEGRPE